MSIGQMWWGSSDVPSSIPSGLDVSYHNTGRGLRIGGGVSGPGCRFTCGSQQETLTFFSRFYLSTSRMPSTATVTTFRSVPKIWFDGYIVGLTHEKGLFDYSSAILGMRLRQYVYSGGNYLGMTQNRYPKLVNVDNELYGNDGENLEGLWTPGEFKWCLDRSQTLEIDVEVRFLMNLEGTGEIIFNSLGNVEGLFDFYVEQWYIEPMSSDVEIPAKNIWLEPFLNIMIK